MPFFPAVICGFCFTPFFLSIHIWLLFHAVFPFPLYMAFVSCRFSLPFTHGFCFMPFFPTIIYGFCFMPFSPSHHTWRLFHAVFPFLLYMVFVLCCFSLPFIHGFCFMPFFPTVIYGFCFMPFFPSLYTWLLFHAVFPFILGICFM